ncbi:MAG: acetate/propionate family kinase [Acidimicrobiales bacterium]
MRVLVLNAGSSSVKVSVVDDAGQRTFDRDLAHHPSQLPAEELQRLAADHGPIDAVGHRIVHGGDGFGGPVQVDDKVLAQIEALTPLAPLHQPAGVAGIRAAMKALPAVVNVACFDTAFHRSLPEAAATYALPADWRSRFGLRRYGFHGLSHAWAWRRAVALLSRNGRDGPVEEDGRNGRDGAVRRDGPVEDLRIDRDRPVEDLRIVTCHLGGGSSLCAIRGGRSQDTTMGFTPLEGLVMETRSGSVDPGLVLWLIQQGGLSPAEVNDGLEHNAGLAALSGTSGDMQEVMAAVANVGNRRAALALEVWLHRLVREIGAMVGALGGLDVLVFTGGIGEHAPDLRARAAARLAYLGVALDQERNAAAQDDTDISALESSCATCVVKAGEDLEIALEVRAHLEPRA